jgi:NifU-like protein
MWDYSEKVKEHFFQPRNARAVEQANAVGDVGSLSCGDALRLTLKVNPETEVIEDAGFQTFGCGSAIASSSALTEIIKGKTIDEALVISNQDIADFLDGLPPEKMHCSVMGTEALQAAIADYRGEAKPEDHDEGELICKCFAIDDELIKRVVDQNQLTTLEQVIQYTKAGGACAACHEKIEWVLDECVPMSTSNEESIANVTIATKTVSPAETLVNKNEPTPIEKPAKKAAKKMGTLQRIRIIEEVLEAIRPGIKADGGDIQLTDVDDDMVFVSLTGACSGCGMSGVTLAMVENKLSEALDEQVSVFPVGSMTGTGGHV